MRLSARLLSSAAVLGLTATAFAAAPAASAAPVADITSASTAAHAGYTGSAAEAKANRAFFEAVMASVAKKRAANPTATAAVTVIYDASRAPSFSSAISRSTQIWNSSVANVKLRSGSAANADFSYHEGNDPIGSYASTDGHGRGYIFIDYAQSRRYDPTRITAHETGHVLGLPDHYSGPCSELMSGGGPGPSCTNAIPNSAERARVNQLWANGLANAVDKVLGKTS